MKHLVTKIKKSYFEERIEYDVIRGPRREQHLTEKDHQSADCEAC